MNKVIPQERDKEAKSKTRKMQLYDFCKCTLSAKPKTEFKKKK